MRNIKMYSTNYKRIKLDWIPSRFARYSFLDPKMQTQHQTFHFFLQHKMKQQFMCKNSVSREENSNKNAAAFCFFHFSLDIFMPNSSKNQTCLIYVTLDQQHVTPSIIFRIASDQKTNPNSR